MCVREMQSQKSTVFFVAQSRQGAKEKEKLRLSFLGGLVTLREIKIKFYSLKLCNPPVRKIAKGCFVK